MAYHWICHIRYDHVTNCGFQIFHCLGFFHEHQRPDRDQYIQIDMDKIHPYYRSQFEIMDKKFSNTTQSYLSEYDTRSITHYDSTVNGLFPDSIMKKKDGSIIEVNKKMSDIDIQTLNKMYPCQQSCGSDINKGTLLLC